VDHNRIPAGHWIRKRSVFADDEWRTSFLMGMFNMAMGLALQLVQQIDLTGRRRLLDLGGGPGTYAISSPTPTAQVLSSGGFKPFMVPA
jgi:hypothetical protein